MTSHWCVPGRDDSAKNTMHTTTPVCLCVRFIPTLLRQTNHSPSLQKASRTNPHPIFSSACVCVTLPDDFPQKNNYTLLLQ